VALGKAPLVAGDSRRLPPGAAAWPPRTPQASSTAISSRTTCWWEPTPCCGDDFGLGPRAGGRRRSHRARRGAARKPPPGSPTLTSLTQTGALIGTPLYMAPEQIGRQAGGGFSDQFSFCVSLYEAWFQARRSRARRSECPPAGGPRGAGPARHPRAAASPRRLRRALLRGLSPAPEQRFPSMEALLRELGRDPRWLAGAGSWRRGRCVSRRGAFALRYVGTQGERMCAGAAEELAQVWNLERSEEVRKGFVATGVPGAARAAEEADRAFTTYGAHWAALRAEACRATRVRASSRGAVGPAHVVPEPTPR